MKIAIVEDELEQQNILKDYINRFALEQDITCQVAVFNDGLELLDDYKADFDLILLDIELPHMDGMTAAQKIRQVDSQTNIIFVTNMARYAIKGYEVNALDFILKPVAYAPFAMKLLKIKNMLSKKQAHRIVVMDGSITRVLELDDIVYIDVANHYVNYHTNTETFLQRGKLTDVEAQLKDTYIVRCNSGTLVNLSYVKQLAGNELYLRDGQCITISRSRKKDFLTSFATFIGGDFR